MAIIGPAKVFGGDIEPRLINRLLDEMGNDPDRLPLLQHCLMRMWFRAKTRAEGQNEAVQNGINLTLEDYEAVGGLKDALSNHAEEAFAEFLDSQEIFYEHNIRPDMFSSEIDFLIGGKIAIEIDGRQFHNRKDDHLKDNRLKKAGYAVYRIKAADCFDDGKLRIIINDIKKNHKDIF